MKKPLAILGILGVATACIAVGHKIYKVVSSSNDVKLEGNNTDEDTDSNTASYKLDPNPVYDDDNSLNKDTGNLHKEERV